MAVYPNMLTTQAGYDLISRANTTKKALIITRAALGKGDLGSNNIVSLTDLIDPVMDNLPLTNSIDHQNGHYEVEASIDNSELDTGFWAKEMGIFAKVDGDATDTLYAYTNGGIYVPYVNDKSSPDIQLVQCDFIVGNATNVKATIDVKVYITEGRLQKHNTDPAAHGDKLVNLTTNGNSLRAVKGDGTNVDVVVPYAANATNATNASYTTTQAATDNSTNIASTAFVKTTVANLVSSAPATLDTLNELANALGNDPNFATTVTKMISQKADKAVVDNIVNVMYPVGIIVEFAKDVDPNATWVGTTWERMSNGRVLVSAGTSGSGTTYTLGATGGEESHNLTTAEMPSHNHGGGTSNGGEHTHTGTTSTNGNHTHTLHKGGSGGSGGAYFSQGQVYGTDSGTVTPPDEAGYHNHTFTTSSNGTHTHTIASDGGSQAHNNMQPYEVVNRWKRTA